MAENKPVTIGITGGIASGKSAFCSYLKEYGFHVLDADKIGHQCYAAGTTCFNEVVQEFGQEIVGQDGEIDRKALSAAVFSGGSRERLDRLNQIVWPHIKESITRNLDDLKQRGISPVFVEAAVLVEANWDVLFDEVWVVYAPMDVSIERLKNTRNLSATVTIWNDKSLEDLKNKADDLLGQKFEPDPKICTPWHLAENLKKRARCGRTPIGIITVSSDEQDEDPLKYFFRYKNSVSRPIGAIRAGDSELSCEDPEADMKTPTAHPSRHGSAEDYTKQFVTASSNASKETLEAAAAASAKEEVLAINHRNEIIGSLPRKKMRDENRWHRATSVMVRRTNGKFVVQRRTLNKDYCPGYLDIPTGGVISVGEEIVDAAYRELSEELGLEGVPLEYCFQFPHQDSHSRSWLYVFTATTDKPVNVQPEEVAEALELSDKDIENLRRNSNEKFTADGIKAWELLREYESAGEGVAGMKAIEDRGAVRDPSLMGHSSTQPESNTPHRAVAKHQTGTLKSALFGIAALGVTALAIYGIYRSRTRTHR